MMSALYYGMVNSFAVFVLRTQRRMIRGLFDLSKDLFYNRLEASGNRLELSYSETSDPASGHHNLSQFCEEWVNQMLGVRPTRDGQILPVFIRYLVLKSSTQKFLSHDQIKRPELPIPWKYTRQHIRPVSLQYLFQLINIAIARIYSTQ